jgi:hypothetical protein
VTLLPRLRAFDIVTLRATAAEPIGQPPYVGIDVFRTTSPAPLERRHHARHARDGAGHA